MKLPIGAEGLDTLLGGGIESNALTEFYGEAGTGKTNICLQLARNCIRKNHKVAYIDTEGVSMERLRQLCADEDDFETVSRNLLVFEPYSMKEQDKAVAKVIQLCRSDRSIQLIIVDSATIFYRLSLGSESERESRRMLTRQVTKLMTLARHDKVPVVVTSHVYTSIERNCISPIGGHALAHVAKTIVHLERVGDGERRAILKKHRSRPESRSAHFTITQHALE